MENHEAQDKVFGDAVKSITGQVHGTCGLCGRGAAGVAAPDLDDLEALIFIRDGFNKHRRSFSPAVAEQFDRFNSVISYLHRMIEGTVDV